MNSIEIKNMCQEIYRDFTSSGRKKQEMDSYILAVIMKFYMTQKNICWEEVRWLWVKFLESGNLLLDEALARAEARIDAEDIKATNELLVAWLHNGF